MLAANAVLLPPVIRRTLSGEKIAIRFRTARFSYSGLTSGPQVRPNFTPFRALLGIYIHYYAFSSKMDRIEH